MVNSPMFSKLFGKSPIMPLQQHMAACLECASQLETFFTAARARDWEAAERQVDEIARLEREADSMKREIRLELSNSLLLPFARTDLLELLSVQDEIANGARDVSGLVLGRKMALPDAINDDFDALLRSSLEVVSKANEALGELETLVATGFLNREVNLINDLVGGLDEAEHESDVIQVVVRRQLFAVEKELHAVDVMFLYKIVELVGELADNAQKIGNRILYLISR